MFGPNARNHCLESGLNMQQEIHGTRDRSYSAWHRVNSLKRFMDEREALGCPMIDIDGLIYAECHPGTFKPAALVELAQDRGQRHKSFKLVQELARRASLEAYVILYALSEVLNPTDFSCYDIKHFRIKQVCPKITDFKQLTPAQWASCLVRIRQRCK